ncbi:MAG TPA: RDD family protein, partial [Thermoanaerobaculia bacterium]|nr:RDD family protein [Thermoanaerobaculia bacterium]
AERVDAKKNIPAAPAIAPPVALSLEEQRAVLDLAERSTTLTQERVEELAELPTPLVGTLDGRRASERLLGIANHIAGHA